MRKGRKARTGQKRVTYAAGTQTAVTTIVYGDISKSAEVREDVGATTSVATGACLQGAGSNNTRSWTRVTH